MLKNYVYAAAAAVVLSALALGCSTAPKDSEQEDVLSRANTTTTWFKQNVTGLDAQIAKSAGYIVFPDVAQVGIIFVGGTRGRGVLFDPQGHQVGWTVIDNASVGLTAGVQGFRMLMVIENDAELRRFKDGKWNGSADGVAVAGERGVSGTAPFQKGLAVYQGASRGLMAGVTVGLNSIRYEPAYK